MKGISLTMKISFANDENANEIRKIWEYCFDDSSDYNNYYFDNIFKAENTVIAKINGKVIAAVQISYYKMQFYNKVLSSAFLLGISTLPEYRGQKAMQNIFLFLIEHLRENNYSLVFLTAKYPNIYKKYGFNFISAQKIYNIPILNVPSYKYSEGLNIRKTSIDDSKILIELFEEFHNDRKIYFKRNKSIFQQLKQELIVESGDIYLIESFGKPIGYFFALISNNELIIRELVYITSNALKAFIWFLHNHKGQAERVLVTTPLDSMLEEMLNWDKNCKIETQPFTLARILDITEFSEFLITTKQSIKINDNIISANNLTIGDINQDTVEIEISQLSQFLFDYININEGKLLGKLPTTANYLLKHDKNTHFLNQYI